MNIWLVQTSESLPIKKDISKLRTAILADKLVEKGHKVLWWGSAFDHFSKEWVSRHDKEFVIKDGLNINVIKGTGYKKNISISRFLDHRVVAWRFRKLASRRPEPDLIIASMPHDIAFEATMFAKRNQIPIVMDIRDTWPDIFIDQIPLKLKSIVKALLFRDFQMVMKTMRMADGLIAVNNTFLEWGLHYAGREKAWSDRVLYLGSKKKKKRGNYQVRERVHDLTEILREKYIILFVGTISSSYHNPSILFEAVKKLEDYHDIHFIVAGDGELFEVFELKARESDKITLTGWLNQSEIEFILTHAKIGVCPAAKVVKLPTNKFYTYLSAGLPVVSAFQGDIKEIIEKHQIGFNYSPNDVDGFVACIKKLYHDKKLYEKMSGNAHKVFDDMFDAEIIYNQYAEHIEKIKHYHCRL